jgi:hypothetical protein
MIAFSLNHASGVICEQRRALLDQFIETNRAGYLVGDLDEQHYKQVLFHIAGCDACRAVWDSRRRGLRSRAIAILTFPLGWARLVTTGWSASRHAGARIGPAKRPVQEQIGP